MTWLITVILAGSLMTTGSGLPVSESEVYRDQGVPVFSKYQETERFEQTYPFSPNGKIQISNLNGSVTIEAWDNPQIYLEAVKYADARERLAEVDLVIDATETSFKAETDYEKWNRRSNWIKKNNNGKYGMLKVEFKLKVPRTAMLDKIETVNGSVYVSDMVRYTNVSTVNGQVKGTNLRGTAKLATVNGSVLADFDTLEDKSIVALETVNGSVKLVVPSDLHAEIRAETLNGSIKNAFGLPVKKGEYVGRELYGRVGGSGVDLNNYSKIKLSSVNGGLTIERKNDGKQANPATNLLLDESSENFDTDFDFDFGQAEKEISADLKKTHREMADSRREMQRSKRIARAELARKRAERRKAARQKALQARKVVPAPEVSKVNAEALQTAVRAIEKAEAKLAEEAARRDAVISRAVEARLNIPSVEQQTGTLSVKEIPSVEITAENVSVSVRGWDRPTVKYSVMKISKDQISKVQNKEAVSFKAEKKSETDVAIEISNDNSGEDEYRYIEPAQVQLEVFVPKKSNLRIVTDDEVRLEGITGEISLRAEDDTVNLRDISGKLILSISDGIARLIGFSGELESELSDGTMFLEGNFLKINASAEDGNYIITLPAETDATIISNTERVKGEGVELVCEDEKSEDQEKRWRIGRGGEKRFNFDLEDGQVTIRSEKK